MPSVGNQYAVAHGHARGIKSPTYKTWRGMKLRCTNPKNASYANYGGKGIGYCPRWESFENFLADMGERPDGLTLDRIRRNEDYGPDNCTWSTKREQTLDRSCTVWIEHEGQTMCMSDWAQKKGLKLTTLKERIAAGWSIDDALNRRPRRYLRQGPSNAA